jgi:hypothetical protein
VTPEHALTEHAVDIDPPQGDRPDLAQSGLNERRYQCPLLECKADIDIP